MSPSTMNKNMKIMLSDLGSENKSTQCPLRKRDTKTIGKSVLTLKGCKRKMYRDYRDKKRVKESRSRKKIYRSPIENYA
jgi:hypothetical protein